MLKSLQKAFETKKVDIYIVKGSLNITAALFKYVYSTAEVLPCNNRDKICSICFFKSTLNSHMINFPFSTTFRISYRAELNNLVPMRAKNICKVAPTKTVI